MPGIKGGWISGADVVHQYPSEMAQNFWTAIYAWTTCFVVTILVSLVTRPRPAEELRGLVYSLTEKPGDEGAAWYARPGTLAIILVVMLIALNIIFF